MRSLLLAMAVGALGCAKKPSPADDDARDAAVETVEAPIDWEVRSFNGVAALTSRGDGKVCSVRCTGPGGAVVWAREECIATRNDLPFVSAECDVVLVLVDAPMVRGSVAASPVGAVWRESGAPTPVRLHQVASLAGARPSESGKWFAWLRGTLEHDGAKPGFDARGAVAFTTLDGVEHTLTFAALRRWKDEPTPPEPAVPTVIDVAAPPAPAPAQSLALFRYQDAEGVEQIGTLEQIPERFRKRAKPISAELDVVQAEPTPGVPRRVGSPPAPAQLAGPNRCELAQQRVAAIERRLAALRPPAECEANPTIRTITGHHVFDAQERLRCTTNRDAAVKAYEAQKAALESERATAQEELRKVQVGGC